MATVMLSVARVIVHARREAPHALLVISPFAFIAAVPLVSAALVGLLSGVRVVACRNAMQAVLAVQVVAVGAGATLGVLAPPPFSDTLP